MGIAGIVARQTRSTAAPVLPAELRITLPWRARTGPRTAHWWRACRCARSFAALHTRACRPSVVVVTLSLERRCKPRSGGAAVPRQPSHAAHVEDAKVDAQRGELPVTMSGLPQRSPPATVGHHINENRHATDEPAEQLPAKTGYPGSGRLRRRQRASARTGVSMIQLGEWTLSVGRAARLKLFLQIFFEKTKVESYELKLLR